MPFEKEKKLLLFIDKCVVVIVVVFHVFCFNGNCFEYYSQLVQKLFVCNALILLRFTLISFSLTSHIRNSFHSFWLLILCSIVHKTGKHEKKVRKLIAINRLHTKMNGFTTIGIICISHPCHKNEKNNDCLNSKYIQWIFFFFFCNFYYFVNVDTYHNTVNVYIFQRKLNTYTIHMLWTSCALRILVLTFSFDICFRAVHLNIDFQHNFVVSFQFFIWILLRNRIAFNGMEWIYCIS